MKKIKSFCSECGRPSLTNRQIKRKNMRKKPFLFETDDQKDKYATEELKRQCKKERILLKYFKDPIPIIYFSDPYTMITLYSISEPASIRTKATLFHGFSKRNPIEQIDQRIGISCAIAHALKKVILHPLKVN